MELPTFPHAQGCKTRAGAFKRIANAEARLKKVSPDLPNYRTVVVKRRDGTHLPIAILGTRTAWMMATLIRCGVKVVG